MHEDFKIKQGISVVRIFLNMFGFNLEKINKYSNSFNLKIFNQLMLEVGNVYFDNGIINIDAKYRSGLLRASYALPKKLSFIDNEGETGLTAYFSQYTNKVNFEINLNDAVKINGEILLICSIDSEFGIKCTCHPVLRYKNADGENIFLKMLRDGAMFSVISTDNEYNEKLEIRPWENSNSYILHDIEKCIYDKNNFPHSYRKFSGIFNGADVGEHKDYFHVFLEEKKGGKTVNYYNDYILKELNNKGNIKIEQIGTLMKNLDQSNFQVIQKIRKKLVIDGVSLLDNFIGICYDNFTDNDLKFLLNLERKKMAYQNQLGNLINTFFEIGRESCILPLSLQKKLLK